MEPYRIYKKEQYNIIFLNSNCIFINAKCHWTAVVLVFKDNDRKSKNPQILTLPTSRLLPLYQIVGKMFIECFFYSLTELIYYLYNDQCHFISLSLSLSLSLCTSCGDASLIPNWLYINRHWHWALKLDTPTLWISFLDHIRIYIYIYTCFPKTFKLSLGKLNVIIFMLIYFLNKFIFCFYKNLVVFSIFLSILLGFFSFFFCTHRNFKLSTSNSNSSIWNFWVRKFCSA